MNHIGSIAGIGYWQYYSNQPTMPIFYSIYNQISDNQLFKSIIIPIFVDSSLKCGKKRAKTAILFV